MKERKKMKMYFANDTEVNPPRKLTFGDPAEVDAMKEKLEDVYLFLNDIIGELIENNYNYLATPALGTTDSLTVDDLGRAGDVMVFLGNNLHLLWGKA